MSTFSLFIQDRRYRIPNLRLAIFDGVDRVVALAEKVLLESEDHLAVEIYDDAGARVANIARAANDRGSARSAAPAADV